jgi:multimeric flavodoxin WrbA
MRLLVIGGSRNPDGQTARAAAALADGARSAGCDTETMFLPTMKIERCRQCDDRGWGACRKEGRCVIDDDFAAVADKIAEADLVAFANPVYFGDLSESLRAFLDRLRRVCCFPAAKDRIKGKPAVGVCVAGGGGGGAPRCTVSLESVLATCGFDVVDVVPARRQNLDMKLKVLNTVGAWLAASPQGAE